MKIVTIGGGSGTTVVNQALLYAGVKNITSVITSMDSGGVTGRMRTDSRGQEIAYSDSLRTLISLLPLQSLNSTKVKNLIQMLRRRNDRGQDLGYTIFSHYFSQETGFGEIQNLLENLTGLKFMGQVLPVTTQSTNLFFKTESGQVFKGEHELDTQRMSADMVAQIWLEPEVTAYIKAVEAIADADFIIYSCGSLYGSVLANLLPKGVQQALRLTKAKTALVTNLASTRNESDNFTPEDFVKIFQKYAKLPDPLDYLIVPGISRTEFEKKYPKVAKRYALEHSHFLGWDNFDRTGPEVDILFHQAVSLDPKHLRLRHDPKKLAKVFKKLLGVDKNFIFR